MSYYFCKWPNANIRVILLDHPTILNKNTGQIYNVKVAVRPLPVPAGNYTNLTFGDSAETLFKFKCRNRKIFYEYFDHRTEKFINRQGKDDAGKVEAPWLFQSVGILL